MNWLQYEKEIFNYLSYEYPCHKLNHNVFVRSKSGCQDRQIDILLEYENLGFIKYAIVDCKNYTNKVNINHVEAFAGLVDDVEATHGILITKSGFTANAIKRASRLNMNLELIDINSLINGYPHTFPCVRCSKSFFGSNLERIETLNYIPINNRYNKYLVFYGMCHSCVSYSFHCTLCNKTTSIDFDPSKEQITSAQCQGNCGISLYINNSYDIESQQLEQYVCANYNK